MTQRQVRLKACEISLERCKDFLWQDLKGPFSFHLIWHEWRNGDENQSFHNKLCSSTVPHICSLTWESQRSQRHPVLNQTSQAGIDKVHTVPSLEGAKVTHDTFKLVNKLVVALQFRCRFISNVVHFHCFSQSSYSSVSPSDTSNPNQLKAQSTIDSATSCNSACRWRLLSTTVRGNAVFIVRRLLATDDVVWFSTVGHSTAGEGQDYHTSPGAEAILLKRDKQHHHVMASDLMERNERVIILGNVNEQDN